MFRATRRIARTATRAANHTTAPRKAPKVVPAPAASDCQKAAADASFSLPVGNPEPPPTRPLANWTLPPHNLLPPPEEAHAPIAALTASLTDALRDLELPARLAKVTAGPSAIAFELEPDEGVLMRAFNRARADLAYSLEAESIRIQAPIPGKRRVGIEIPNPTPRAVALSEVAAYAGAPLRAALGVATSGAPVTLDVARLPHLAIAGASGSGKSSLIHALVCSLLMTATPDELSLVLVDTKRVELGQYAGIPHLVIPPVTRVTEAIRTFEGLADEVERREDILERHAARDINAYNRTAPEGHLPACLCIVDEFADLMLQNRKRVEAAVVKLGQIGRACGVHLILATQSPHREVFSGLIKANTPARIALRVTSGTHSRVAIDQAGAELLAGQGDALLQDGQSVALRRFQAAYVPAELVESIVEHWRPQTLPETT